MLKESVLVRRTYGGAVGVAAGGRGPRREVSRAPPSAGERLFPRSMRLAALLAVPPRLPSAKRPRSLTHPSPSTHPTHPHPPTLSRDAEARYAPETLLHRSTRFGHTECMRVGTGEGLCISHEAACLPTLGLAGHPPASCAVRRQRSAVPPDTAT